MLYQTAVSSCIEVLKNKLKWISDKKDDCKLLSLMIDIFKVYRKCVRHIHEKECAFSSVLVEAYIIYMNKKGQLQENCNHLDLALKLCAHEINYRKTKEKMENDPKNVDTTLSDASKIQPISSVSNHIKKTHASLLKRYRKLWDWFQLEQAHTTINC